jgi:hypothetical protein
MREIYKSKRVWGLGAFSIILIVAGLLGRVSAQEPGAPSDVGLDVTIRADSGMSGAQQVNWVQDQSEAVKSVFFRAQSMLDKARKDKDILRIGCLDDKLTQVRVNLKGIEQRTQSLKLAVQSGDKSTSNQQFAILKIYISRIQGLEAEAENCLGEVDVVLGQTETTVEIDDDITIEDPSEEIQPDNVGVQQWPHASGYY